MTDRDNRYLVHNHHEVPQHFDISTLPTVNNSLAISTIPRKSNPNPFRQHYSRDLKTRIVYQAYTLHKNSTDISIDLDIPMRVVQRVLRSWKEIGEVFKDRRRVGRAPLMKGEEV